MRDAALECPVSGEDMKTKTIVLTLALCFVAAAVCFADDAFTGTWKLNEAKSKMAPNAPKNNTVVYEAAGDNVKITVDGIGLTFRRWTTAGPFALSSTRTASTQRCASRCRRISASVAAASRCWFTTLRMYRLRHLTPMTTTAT